MGKAFIGTSGWQYGHWRGSFYPQDLPTAKWLTYYASFFNTVEVNGSFYHEIKASTVEKWKKQVPADFTFSLKGHRFITHIKRLQGVKESLKIFFKNSHILIYEKKSPPVILWQLPPGFKKDTERLEKFLKLLPKQFRHAFEFRHQTWVDDEVWQILKKSKTECTAVLQDWPDWPRLTEPWEKFVYLRFHGAKQLYASNYSERELAEWANQIKAWLRAGLFVYAYFNNDAQGWAVPNATRLKELIED